MKTRVVREVPYSVLEAFIPRKADNTRSQSPPLPEQVIKRLQQEHWARFHGLGRVPTEDWIAQWLATIPGVCGCQKAVRPFLEENPVSLATTSLEACRGWGFDLHNFVNRKLGKPELTWTQATETWGW